MYTSPQDRIAELESENARLQAMNAALVRCMKKANVSWEMVSAAEHRYSFELSCKTTQMSTNPRSLTDLPSALLDRVDEYAGSDFFVRAAAEGDLPLVNFCTKAGMNMKGDGAVVAFRGAASGNQAAVVRMLISARAAGVDAALISAATKGNVEVARILLSAGADPKSLDSAGDSALTVAVPTGNAALIGCLLANGAEANGITNGNGLTPLGLAARGGQTGIVDVLLQSGADVNAINQPCDNTALMLAACMGHLGVVSRLLQAGADGSLRNANRLAAVDLAKEGRHSAIVEMLHHWDANTI
jgi:hypothetical protein